MPQTRRDVRHYIAMPFGQPRVSPLPKALAFEGQTALVTGANRGLGFATSLHLLQRRISRLVITVRTRANGESAKTQLLADPVVVALPVQPEILIYELDLASEKSVVNFSEAIQRDIAELDIAVFNAGMYAFSYRVSPETQREMTFQVNYVSTALLGILLLPLLRATSVRKSSPSHITFVGSEMATQATVPVLPGRSVFDSMSAPEGFAPQPQYGRSKLVLAMFVKSLAERVDASQVIVNNVCPGAVRTNLAKDAPSYLRPILPLFYFVKQSRTPEVGSRLILLAAAGEADTHGHLITNAHLTRYFFPFMYLCMFSCV